MVCYGEAETRRRIFGWRRSGAEPAEGSNYEKPNLGLCFVHAVQNAIPIGHASPIISMCVCMMVDSLRCGVRSYPPHPFHEKLSKKKHMFASRSWYHRHPTTYILPDSHSGNSIDSIQCCFNFLSIHTYINVTSEYLRYRREKTFRATRKNYPTLLLDFFNFLQ